ncbi:MAG: thioredoxin family protein [Hadesarchaea archaeon]|nr:thioredoxin family protein [Hadesarchaea archaeon]
MKIEVFHSDPPCKKCKKSSEIVKEVAKEFEDIAVEEFGPNDERFDELGIMMTPTTVIEEQILKQGGVPREDEVRKAIQKFKGD